MVNQVITVKVIDAIADELTARPNNKAIKIPAYVELVDGAKEVVYAGYDTGMKLAALIGNMVTLQARTRKRGGMLIIGIVSARV